MNNIENGNTYVLENMEIKITYEKRQETLLNGKGYDFRWELNPDWLKAKIDKIYECAFHKVCDETLNQDLTSEEEDNLIYEKMQGETFKIIERDGSYCKFEILEYTEELVTLELLDVDISEVDLDWEYDEEDDEEVL